MEEADLLKERLQAITDKRRIQEDIAKKRRQIEEEKLKLQYIKKKALRDQWLMDGLSQQSEEEQEAMRLQAQDEQQQSDQLQSNILRIEKEIEALEAHELSISANEEIILKRLKEVERTPEDIIKVGSDQLQNRLLHFTTQLYLRLSIYIHAFFKESFSIPATFAMEISVELDKRTGKSLVVSKAHITPETIHERGLKVYDDGRKSVYALNPDTGTMHNGEVGELTSTEVEELLRQATDKNVPTGVQYHQPVYSVPYTGSSRPSTPRTPNKTPTQTPTPSHSSFQSTVPSRNGAQVLREEIQHNSGIQKSGEETKLSSPASSGDFNRCSPFCAESITSLNLVDNLSEELESGPITMIFMGYENAEDEDEEDFQAELVMIANSDDNEDDDAQYLKSENDREEYLSYHPEGCKSKVFQPKVGIAKVTSCRDVTEDAYINWDDLGLHKPTFIHKPGKHSTKCPRLTRVQIT
uniref:Palmdelphin n=1 Tax=Anabas testudineus TaxID=64144 RepID=A0A3Q1J7X5_ANATE